MVESGRFFSQEEYDRKLGVPEELCGQLSSEAQMARFFAHVSDGMPAEQATQILGLTDEDFKTIAWETTL